MTKRRGRYGIDAPYAPAFMGLGGVVFLGLGLLPGSRMFLVSAAILLPMTACYLHTTLRGKFAAWSDVLDGLALRGDERLLDLGCGRGAVLLLAARRLPQGKAIGIDIWSSRDQSGNALATTEDNAVREGVAERVELRTADMRELPFPDASFDVIVSNVAIHNIPDAAGRVRAIDEAWRVLAPGGRLRIADMRHLGAYRSRLATLGACDLRERSLGWRMWWGGPWVATRLIEARKPVPATP